MTPPRRPEPEAIPGTPSHRLIRGVMRMGIDPPNAERVTLYRSPHWTVSLVDTGAGDDAPRSPAGDTTVHMLWQMDEANAAVTVDGEHFPIAPGDTMSVPGGSPLHLSAGMLLVRVEASSRTLDGVLPPSHGVESYEGYNRRTDYDTPDAFSVQRWKITQPLTVQATGTPYAIIDLASPLALVWPGGTDLIGRGECRVVEPETGAVTLLPDGLGYALVVR